MDNILRIQLKLAAAPETVFAALTDSAALKGWFAEHAEIALDNKQYDFWGKFTPENPDRDAGRHELLTVEPNRLLKYRWQITPTSETLVEIKLLPQGETTILSLLHHLPAAEALDPAVYTVEDFWLLSLENLRRYIDGKPSDARVDFSAPMRGDIRHETEIDAPAARVFDVLIQPDQLERWIAHQATVTPGVDGSLDIGWQGIPPFKIVAFEEGKLLSYIWPDGEDLEHLYDTVVTWTLEESNGKTRLTFVHSGFRPADKDTGGIHAGWRNYVNWVRSIAEYGAGWQPAIKQVAPEMAFIYPAVVIKAQSELLPLDQI